MEISYIESGICNRVGFTRVWTNCHVSFAVTWMCSTKFKSWKLSSPCTGIGWWSLIREGDGVILSVLRDGWVLIQDWLGRHKSGLLQSRFGPLLLSYSFMLLCPSAFLHGCVSQFSSLWQTPKRKLKRILETIDLGHTSEISVHGHLAPLFLGHGEAEHHGRE
jgi:hypothetical protein